jgi:hypothetical protein
MRDQTGMIDNIRRSPLMGKLQVKPDEDQFGPTSIEPLHPIEQKERDTENQEEIGPVLEQFGPTSSSIRIVPANKAIAVLSERNRR